MRLLDIAHLYWVRLKARAVLVQEAFSVLGIAVGVALLFASQVASASLNGSVQQLTNGIIGQSKYQLTARDTQGFSEGLVAAVKILPGVRAAIPVLEEHASVIGPKGERSVDLIGSDPGSVGLAGPLLRHFSASQLAHQEALALPAPIAATIGAGSLQTMKLAIGASATPVLLAAILQSSDIGPLVHSPVAVAPLAYVQRLTGMRGRISRVFVQVKPGRDHEVRSELASLAAGQLNVEPADYDATLFAQAATPVNQSTSTFAAICALIGFMFAYCSMLLTMHLRQGLARELRRIGSTRWETVKVLLFDALVLGGLASVLGLIVGEALSTAIFRSNPGYLSFAFPVGSQRIVTWQSIALSVGAGMLAGCIGVLSPLRDIWNSPRTVPLDSGRHRGRWQQAAGLIGGAVCLGTTTLILVLAPQSAILGIVALVLALLLLLPVLLDAVVSTAGGLQRRLKDDSTANGRLRKFGGGTTELAIVELRSPSTRVRSVAVATTGALAVFASVTIQGSHNNLQNGLDRLFHGVTNVSALWVVPPGEANLLATTPFSGSAATTLRGLPGVEAVGLYHAGFLEYQGRRVWVLAPPTTTTDPLPASQLVSGDFASATRRLDSGGWAILSEALARHLGLRIGQHFTLPSPSPTSLRVAALSTNLGWPPGAVVLNADDYTRAWSSSDPSAYNLVLSSGANPRTVQQEVRAALGPSSGLSVQTAQEREASQRAASREGLGRLTQIALIVLVAGILATATSLTAMIWQRRRQFARMKVQGYTRKMLHAALVWESAMLLGTGGLVGALLGIFGQLLLSHALLAVTGFPVIFSARAPIALAAFMLITAVGAAIVAISGYRAASVQPYA
jgi:putative ABC transport system permease protein